MRDDRGATGGDRGAVRAGRLATLAIAVRRAPVGA
jgi:hypothetical protein